MILSLRQERNPTTVSQLLTQIQDLQHKVNSLSDAGAALERPTFPVNPPLFRVPEPCLAAILDCCTLHGILLVPQETFFERLPAREGLPSALFENSKNLASSSHELRPDISGNTMVLEMEMRREPQNTSIFVPHFQSGCGTLKHIGGIYSHSCMNDYPRFPISELHLGKFRYSMEFQSWKVNFKTAVCSKAAYPHLTMHWIKEGEMAKSIDELVTSRSIVGRTDFTDYVVLDAMIASALKKLLDKHVHF